MENLPLISVIIPVYNVEKYLEECVESVLTQTYKNIEIILVDDGSTDSSGEICDSYALQNSNVQVIHQLNAGLSDARTAGLKKAIGKYVYFLDSDDYIAADALEKLCMIAENDSSDIVFFDAHSFIDENRDSKMKQTYLRAHKYQSNAGFLVFEQMQQYEEYHSAVWAMLLKREFILKNSISFISGIYYEDMAFTFEALCLAKKVSQCPECLYFRRYRKNSIMTSKKNIKYFDSTVILYKHLLQFVENNKLYENVAVKKYIARISYNVFNNYNALSKNDQRTVSKIFSEIKKDILKNNAFGDTALRLKCHNNVLWFIYKAIKKVFG